MHKNQRRPFTDQENNFIRQSVKLVGEDWEIIAKVLPGRSPKQIHDRYQNYLRDGLKKEQWTKEEDKNLIKLYQSIGPKWTKMISKLPGRSANDIKNRWHKHLIKEIPVSSKENKNDEHTFVDSQNLHNDINLNSKANNDFDNLFNSIIMKDDYEIDDFKDGVCFENYDFHFI